MCSACFAQWIYVVCLLIHIQHRVVLAMSGAETRPALETVKIPVSYNYSYYHVSVFTHTLVYHLAAFALNSMHLGSPSVTMLQSLVNNLSLKMGNH